MNITIKELDTSIEICQGYSEETNERHLSHTEESNKNKNKDSPIENLLRTETIFIHCHIPRALQLSIWNSIITVLYLSPCGHLKEQQRLSKWNKFGRKTSGSVKVCAKHRHLDFHEFWYNREFDLRLDKREGKWRRWKWAGRVEIMRGHLLGSGLYCECCL